MRRNAYRGHIEAIRGAQRAGRHAGTAYRRRRSRAPAVLLSVVLLGAALIAIAASAAVTPAGGEVIVNVQTANAEVTNTRGRNVAVDALGNYAIVWASTLKRIFVRLFSADGTPLTGDVEVTTASTRLDVSLQDMSIARNPAGDIVVVWEKNVRLGPGMFDGGIFARRVSADGTPLGAEIQVDTTFGIVQRSPSVAMAAHGSFVVVWEAVDQPGDANQESVQLRRFAADGTPLGGEFQVNALKAGDQSEPDIGMAPDGRFVVAFSSHESGVVSADDVFARRFSADGTPLGGEFPVNTASAADGRDHDDVSVAMDPSGAFVVAWEGESTNEDDVYLRLYSAAGVPLTGEIQANTTGGGDTGAQEDPVVSTAGPCGAIVVGWESEGVGAEPDQDGDREGVVLRVFDQSGNPISDEVLVNTTTADDQEDISVAIDPAGRIVTVWTTVGGPTSLDVASQRFLLTPLNACALSAPGGAGSAVVAPFVLTSKTTFRLSNHGSENVNVHMVRVCGAEKSFGGQGFCVATDRETALTPMQTRIFNVENFFSVSAADCPAGFVLAYAAVDDPLRGQNTPISWNFLTGSVYYRDSGPGALRASGVQGTTVTSPQPPKTPIGTGGAFPVLPFDGAAFNALPTRYVSDFRAASGAGVSAKGSLLTLLTLDIQAGAQNDPTLVSLDWSDQGEVPFSGSLEYVCHVRVPLEDIPGAGGSFTQGGLGSQFGMLAIEPFGTDAILGFIEELENNRATWRRLYHDDVPRTTTFIGR